MTAAAAVLAALILGSPSRGEAAAAPPGKDPNRSCLRCHAMATLAVRDERTGGIVSLAVDPAGFAGSNHRRLRCIQCHSREFRWYPHPEETVGERLRCLGCHDGDPRLEKYAFPAIGREVARSVHVKRLGRSFDCLACHEPHSFRLAGDSPGDRVAAANAACLSCHSAPEAPVRFVSLTTRAFPDLDSTHAWLPNTRLHWRKVRCLDCHAGAAKPAPRGHLIVPAEDALRDCAGCHSRNSVLFSTLYRHRVKESRAALGFVNAALLNDAYVIGATRNLLVDAAGLGLLALALAGVAIHALLRGRP